MDQFEAGGLTTCCRDGLCCFVDFRLRAGYYRHCGSSLGERLCKRPTDAIGAASHNDHISIGLETNLHGAINPSGARR